MSSAQSGLIPKGETTEIVTPLADRQVQVHRDNAASGDGTYYGRLPDGTDEPIGGPGFAASSQLVVEITYVEETRVLSSVVTGGVAPFTYLWDVKSNAQVGSNFDIISYSGATNAATATLNSGEDEALGMASVKVTDANGRVSYGYYMAYVPSAA